MEFTNLHTKSSLLRGRYYHFCFWKASEYIFHNIKLNFHIFCSYLCINYHSVWIIFGNVEFWNRMIQNKWFCIDSVFNVKISKISTPHRIDFENKYVNKRTIAIKCQNIIYIYHFLSKKLFINWILVQKYNAHVLKC